MYLLKDLLLLLLLLNLSLCLCSNDLIARRFLRVNSRSFRVNSSSELCMASPLVLLPNSVGVLEEWCLPKLKGEALPNCMGETRPFTEGALR